MPHPNRTLNLLVQLGVLAKADARALEDLLQEIQAADELNRQQFNAHHPAIPQDPAGPAAPVGASLEMLRYAEAIANAGQDTDPAAARLERIQEISAAQTAAHLKELEELQKIEIAWLKAHPAQSSPDRIAAAEASNRRELGFVADAAARRRIAQIQEDLDERQQRQPYFDTLAATEAERLDRATAALNLARRDKHAAPDAEAAGVQDRKIAAAEIEQQAAADAWQRVRTAGITNAAAITRERGLVATATGVEDARESGERAGVLLNVQAGKMHLTLGQLMVATGKSHEQSEAILRGILDQHLNLITVLNQLAAQFVAQQQQMALIKQQLANLASPAGSQ